MSASNRCPRPDCHGTLWRDPEDGEMRCLCCGRSPAPVTGADLMREPWRSQVIAYSRLGLSVISGGTGTHSMSAAMRPDPFSETFDAS